MFSTLRTHILCTFRHPRIFFSAKPFFIVWTLYAATYTTANAVESAAKEFTQKKDQLLVSSITFLSTCIVNVPLGVWKDVRFVQIYGRNMPTPNTAINTPTTKPPEPPAAAKTPIVSPAKFPRIVGATFLFRDAITILGSFTLPSMVPIPDSFFSDPAIKMAATQLFVPILSQVVATPVHLLGLDLYSYPHKDDSAGRAERIKKNLGPTTMVRCCRIIPAFGVGCIVNTGLREHFHSKTLATST